MNLADVSFNELMSPTGIQFIVPIWQRLYSWEDKQWNDLWDDLMNLYERLEKGQSIEHFLGPIVVKTTEERVGQMSKRILIDGQQRLTTLIVLCALLRSRAKERNDNQLADEISDSYLFNRYAKAEVDKLKLTPTEADLPSFKIISDGSDLDSLSATGSQLAHAYSFFELKLKEMGPSVTDVGLLNCIKRLRLVTINLSPTDDPNRIFETLNSRGKELDQSDLIRNYFMMAPKKDTEAATLYETVWYPMQQRLGSDSKERTENLEEFFRQYMIMNNQRFVKEDAVYEELKTKLRFNDESGKITELRVVGNDSKLYQRLLFPENETNQQIKRGLQRINRLRVGVSYPFLLKAYRLYTAPSPRLEVEEFADILSSIESFAVRRLFHNAPTHSLNRFFASLCTLDETDLAKELRETFGSKQNWEAQYCPTDAEFAEDITYFQIYRESSDRCRFVLETLEESIGHPEPVKTSDLTIEHVMPETLTDAWKSYLGKDWEQIFNTFLHTLPNLTLIAASKNSSLQNSLFSKKKLDWYSKSNVGLTKEIRDNFNDWSEKEIRERANMLAKRAIGIWPRPS